MNERDFARTYLGEVKTKNTVNGTEIEAKYCPFCGGGIHKDTFTFSINEDRHTFNCLRGKCGESGTFKDLAERYGEQADYYLEWLKENGKDYNTTRIYTQPKFKIQDLNKYVIEYFKQRGISEQTLIKMGVKSFYSKSTKQYLATFQFLENGKLVMNKFRLLRKPKMLKNGKKEQKEWKETGGKHVLWNMQNIDKEKEVILTEGMVDALSLVEAGATNVVSIPSGTNDLTWIDNCFEWIQSIKGWTIYVDNDDAGEKLKNELLMKFGFSKCKVVEHELNDANDELNVLGKEYIKKVIKGAKYEEIKGLTDISKVNMLDISKLERCSSSIKVIDKFCGGFTFPNLTIWTGKRGSGKSTLAGQSIAAAVDQGYNGFVYTGEMSSSHFKLWLYSQFAGEKNIETITHKYDKSDIERPDEHIPREEIVRKIDNWINGRLKMYDDQNTNKEDEIIRLMEESYIRYNTRIFLLDNLTTIKFNPNRGGKYEAQSDFIDRLRLFALKYNVNINVVVHPRKTGLAKEFDNDDIGGSGDITNLAFNVYWVTRINSDDELDLKNPVEQALQGCQSKVEIFKNRWYGTVNAVGGMKFSTKSKRFYAPTGWTWKYNWEKEAEQPKGITEIQEGIEVPW